MNVPFYRHGLGPSDAGAIARVLESPMLTSGAVGREVEAQIASFFDAPHALLVNSWTNGALAALLALDIKPGDEVIVPAMTFIATANMVELLGAKAVFVDVDPATLMLTPEAIARAVTPRTKAVIPVHLYGQMADIRGMRAAIGPKIAIIEDCAHCFEGTRDGYAPGVHSDVAIFSFYATKNVTCGEGGAIITRRDDLADAMRKTRLHGMSAGAADRYRTGGYRHWDMERLGVKANLPDLLAALLPPQIARVREVRNRREQVAARYRAGIESIPGVRLPHVDAGAVHAWHLFTIGVPPAHRDATIAGLNERGIGVAVNYRSVPTLTFYREKYGYTAEQFPVSYAWGESTITLPTYPGLTEEEIDAVIAALREVVASW
jgi:UDP-4-amino-4-deoxy-L-arabinose-oxoglutarate aminotransferase